MRDADENDGLLGALLDAAVDAIIVSDAAGVVVRANTAAARLFGYEPGAMIGISIACLMPEGARQAHSAAMTRFLKTGEPHVIGTGRDVEGLRIDGSLFPAHLSLGHAVVKGRDYFVAILHDLSQRAAIEQALNQAQRLEALGALTGGVAHDFNNVLTIISGSLELLQKSVSGEGERELIRAAMEAAELGANLTARLLMLGRRGHLSPQLLDPVAAAEAAISLLQATLGPGIQLHLAADGAVWPIRVDPTQLQSALINLAVNAQDAMPDGGEITLSVKNLSVDDRFLATEPNIPRGNYVRISVADTGTGMNEDVRRRAFEPFFTTKPAGKGTGLGLSMVYGFAEQSGGSATLDSVPGLGTTVSLYFPAIAPGAADPASSPVGEAAGPPDGSRYRVLVVEDDDAVRRLSVARLEALGYEALAAANPEEALAILGADRNVDVLFADIVMPGRMNGDDLARQVQSEHPHVSILLTSGFAGGLAATSGGAFPLLHKPYRQSELSMRLRILLSRRRG